MGGKMKNREGYMDVTAQLAIGRVDSEKKRLKRLTDELNSTCKRNGFTPVAILIEDSRSHNSYTLKQQRDKWR